MVTFLAYSSSAINDISPSAFLTFAGKVAE
jgi:hypothetical protein